MKPWRRSRLSTRDGREGVEAHHVQYEVLPFVLDPEEALKPGAPQLFEDGNLEGQPRILNRGISNKG